MAGLQILAVGGVATFVIGGILATLMKYRIPIEALGAFLLLGLIVSVILIALRSVVALVAILGTLLFAGMAIFTLAFLA